MKQLFKIIGILLFLIVAVNLHAENIDECKSDLYYANGIMMKYSEEKALRMWKKEVEKLLLSNIEVYAKITNVKMSYNLSQGFLDDLLESFEQVMSNEWGWMEYSVYFANYLKGHGIQELDFQHNIDLDTQITAYKNSIKLGHSVIVIAHSQGNYFTNEAYEYLDVWMQPYFHMMGVATPANHVAGFTADDTTAPYVKFHNDFIKSVATGLPSNRVDPNTNHNQTFSIAAHDFYKSYLSAKNTRADIQNFILNQVTEHDKSSSQWKTDQEFDRNTCDYKITVKHRFDPSIEMAEKVYPFNGSKKLYSVNGEYVKASCGGKNILDQWDGKKENECWMIDNVEEEKIVGKQKEIPDNLTYIVSAAILPSFGFFTNNVYTYNNHEEKKERTRTDFSTCSDARIKALKTHTNNIKNANAFIKKNVDAAKNKYGEDVFRIIYEGSESDCLLENCNIGDTCLMKRSVQLLKK